MFSLFNLNSPLGFNLGVISPAITTVLLIWFYFLNEPRKIWYSKEDLLLTWIFHPISASFNELQQTRLSRIIPLLHSYTTAFRCILIVMALCKKKKLTFDELIYRYTSLFLLLGYLILHFQVMLKITLTKFFLINCHKDLFYVCECL